MTGPAFLEASCLEADNIVPTPTAVVRTRIQQSVGGYRKDLPHTGDMEMWLRIAAHCSVGVVDADQAFYRTHVNQMSVTYAGTRDLVAKREAFHTVFREHAGRIPNAEHLRRLADRRLAGVAFWRASQLFDRGERQALEEFLRFAVSVDPRIRLRPMWWRFVAKRAAGVRVWSAVSPFFRRLRSTRGSARAALTPRRHVNQ